jgi:cytoskeletal protein CcmA (bactofilin family)
MILLKKIKAGALQFVLFVGAVVALLLLSFLLLSHTQQHFQHKSKIWVEVLQSVEYGMQASLSKPMQTNQEIQIEKPGNLPIEIRVKKNFWGLLEQRAVTAAHGKTTFTKIGLTGGKYLEELPALYVNDHQRPVVLAGNAKITGTAYLPQQGVKMGNIGGNSYHLPRLIYGNSLKSDSNLPKLDTEFLQQMQRWTQNNFKPEGTLLQSLPKEGLKNSFQQETKIYKGRRVTLENIRLTGNIVIVADEVIKIHSSARLQDVILLAPKIEIGDGVVGNFQAIATKGIEVGQKCNLFYPSVLAVNFSHNGMNLSRNTGADVMNRLPKVFIGKNSEIRGFIMALEENEERQYTPQIKIETNALIQGEIYVTKNLELKGTVQGMVTTDGFIALENGNIYQNHLYNGVINSTQLSPAYVGIPLTDRVQNKKLMQWLY